MAVRTWVGRFCAADGRVDEEGPWLGSLVRRRPDDDDTDELYVLIEPASDGSEEYTRQLVEVIAQLYHRDPLSLTGALTRALRAAHEHLREWNRRSLPEHRVGAGASCLVIRGTEAYLAQVGPSLAYLRRGDGTLRQITAHDASFEQSLGVAAEFEPRLMRLELEPGDVVLVASTQLDDIVPRPHVERILARDADDILPEFYLLCRDRPNFALVLLSCFAEAEELPDFLSRNGTGEGSAHEPPAAEVAVSATGELVPAPINGGTETAVATLAAGSADEWAAPRRPAHEEVREIKRSTAPPPPANVRLRGDAATLRYRKTTGASLPDIRVPRMLIFGALALIVLGLIAWWQIPGSVRESREDRFVALLAEARESNARAQATSDGGTKRQLLVDARSSLLDAEKIHADNEEVASLQADVASALMELDHVVKVNGLTTIAQLEESVTGELAVTDAVIGGGSAYFLDAKGGRVLRVLLAGGAAPETILEQGKAGGVVTAGTPVQIAWAEQTHGLLIFDDRRQVFEYFPEAGDSLPIAIRNADGIGSIDAVAAAGENMYILDVKENQVWRYLPGEGGFDSERTALLDAPDLANATELAVGEDVYVLDDELGVRRFRGSAEAGFPLAGIDRPMMSPASLSVLAGSNRIVVADRGNKRIVIATDEGEFLRQIVSTSFTDLRAVAVDEGTGTLYVLNGDTLLKAAFPP